MDDRRETERFPFSAFAEIIDCASKSRLPVRIADVSRNGCYVDSINVLPVGTSVHIAIQHAGSVLEIAATVINSLTSMGMGLSFRELPPEITVILGQWLDATIAPPATISSVLGAAAQPVPATAVTSGVLSTLIKIMLTKKLLSESECSSLLENLQP